MSEDYAASIIRVEEKAKHETSIFACCLFHAGLLLRLLFNPENEDDIFIRRIG
jgi:hypothetical protein